MEKDYANTPDPGVVDWCSHHPFEQLLAWCVRGNESEYFEAGHVCDHMAELSLLKLDDIEEQFFFEGEKSEGAKLREIVGSLAAKARDDDDLEAGELLFSLATAAAFEVMGLYLRKRDVFDRIAPRRKLLPILASIHPKTESVAGKMLCDSRLGSKTNDRRRVLSRSWFESDSAPNLYARAIEASITLNQNLEPIEQQRASWKRYDTEYGVETRVLPIPTDLEDLESLPKELTPDSVKKYWRKGKQIIQEELPEFHLRPEWESYHNRNYPGGAKPGAIRSAIFRDLLAALGSIAGKKT